MKRSERLAEEAEEAAREAEELKAQGKEYHVRLARAVKLAKEAAKEALKDE